MNKNGSLIWIAPDQQEFEVSEDFLTWEDSLRSCGKEPLLEKDEMQLYFLWLLCGSSGDLRSTEHYQRFYINRPADLRVRATYAASLWKELRRYTDYYDECILYAMGIALQKHNGLYFEIACEVLQPSGIRLYQTDTNSYGIELYQTVPYHIINDELLRKIEHSLEWYNRRTQKSQLEQDYDFSDKWDNLKWGKTIYQSALLYVLKNGKVMEREFGGGICVKRQGELLLRSKKEFPANTRYSDSVPYKLACLCAKIEETLDRVLAGEIARCEAGWIDSDAEGDRLIRQIVLKFCLEQYPQFFM